MRPIILVLAAGVVAITTAAPAAESVDIPNGDLTLRSALFRPPGEGPFPAVVALHGCGGLFNRSGKLASRFAKWGERLAAFGIAVVFPDSFASRGLTSQCRVRERKVRASRERVVDANVARRWLQDQSWTIKERVSLIGWSDGGIATLWAVRPRALVRDGKPDFRSAVALYPGCGRLRDAAWSARVPTLILVGQFDDWTPAVSCEQMVSDARGRTARTSIVVYPGAHHEFDRAAFPIRMLSGLAHSADGSGRVHVGTNAAARKDALKRVPQWLLR